jgi:hypothetical protein
VIGKITQSDVVFKRDNKLVNGLSGWDHFA